MNITKIPPVEEIQAALQKLTPPQIERLGELSGVPRFTISKIRNGVTTNPGIETVRKFVAHISAARRAVAF